MIAQREAQRGPQRYIPAGLLDRHVEARWPGVYFNPQRWATADGYIPFPVFDRYAAALWPVAALERLNMAHSIGLAFGDPKTSDKMHRAAIAEAYPGETDGQA